MKFIKLLILIFIINNFAFSAEIDKKMQKEETSKIDRTIKGKEIVGKIYRQENELFICYNANLENNCSIICTKFLKTNLIDCSISFKHSSRIRSKKCNKSYFYMLERLYNKQNSKKN